MSDSSHEAFARALERRRLLRAIDAPSADLRHQATRRWGQSCPCCGQHMTTKPPKKGSPTARSYRTMGHNMPVGGGGRVDQWIFICHGCNNEQGWRSFEHWGNLMRPDDPRKERTIEVGRFFRANGEQS